MSSTKRRSFLKRTLGALGLAPLLGFTLPQVPSVGGSFVHVVYFWMKNPEDAAARETFLRNLVAFLNRVDVIRSYHVGTPANTPRDIVDNSYTFAIVVTFDGREGHDIYQDHPEHLSFIDQTSNLWTKVQIYDSESVA